MLTPSMKRIFSMSRCFTAAIFGLSLLAIFAVQPASATTYSFVMPVANLQTALDSALGLAKNPALYGFYDLYIRPEVAGGDAYGGNVIDFSSTEVGANPPITSSTDGWSADFGTTGPSPTCDAFPCFHFTYNPGDSVVALITPSTNFNGRVLPAPVSLPAEQMPTTASFVMTINSPTPI